MLYHNSGNFLTVPRIVRFIKAQRIKWLGHIQRMDQAKPTGKLLDWKPMGSRPVGKPRQRWQEDVMEDLKKLKVKNWKEAAKDRRTWRDLAEKAKPHKGFSAKWWWWWWWLWIRVIGIYDLIPRSEKNGSHLPRLPLLGLMTSLLRQTSLTALAARFHPGQILKYS